MQRHLPPGVEVEEYEGEAWVSLVLFRLKVRPCCLPFVPGVSTLTEANVRTYVRAEGRSGIYFLNIRADNRLAVRLARLFTPLPYRVSRMSYRRAEDGFRFERKAGRPSRDGLRLEFRPSPGRRAPADDSLEAWLLERYRAFARRGDVLVAAEVSHPRWSVGDVELLGVTREAASWWADVPPRPPDLIHYSEGVDALFGPFRAVARARPSHERVSTRL